jgi:site-specific DNA-methyltransferase (adenine-specific)
MSAEATTMPNKSQSSATLLVSNKIEIEPMHIEKKSEGCPESFAIELGDCLEILRAMQDSSVDSIVTDPPYGLSFMGKKWDHDVPSEAIWRECLRVLKPGGHLLAFAGTRTQHRMAVRIEDAGFEIRDMIAWVYSSGFPKSLNVSKAIDKKAGAECEVIGSGKGCTGNAAQPNGGSIFSAGAYQWPGEYNITAPATDAARQWQGWGTALKPALEPITVARKPLIGTVAENVMAHGTGAVNVDGCRVGDEVRYNAPAGNKAGGSSLNMSAVGMPQDAEGRTVAGRWPANLIHDGSDEVLAGFPQAPGQMAKAAEGGDRRKDQNVYGAMTRGSNGAMPRAGYQDWS